VHTMFDGDTVFALATGHGSRPRPEEVSRLAVLAVEAVERAVVNAVRFATPAGGLPSADG
jgi:L-aminopeptidase/D-esterase-like protein